MLNKQVLLSAVCLSIAAATTLAAQTATSGAVLRMADDSTVEGASSTLVRTADGVEGTLLTTIDPMEAATIWWVVFNRPENCTGGVCDGDDVMPAPGNVDAGVSVIYATGRVADAYGKADFGAKLTVGDMSYVMRGPGLTDAKNAEIHMIVRSHGPAVPELVQEQISTFDGGCPDGGCTNIQFSVHQAYEDAQAEQTARIEDLVKRIAQRLSIQP